MRKGNTYTNVFAFRDISLFGLLTLLSFHPSISKGLAGRDNIGSIICVRRIDAVSVSSLLFGQLDLLVWLDKGA